MLAALHLGPPLESRDARRLAWAWIAALFVLAGVAGASCWLSVRALHQADDSRLLLAISRQRMLSQRVALLAHQYVAAQDEYVRLDLNWELRASADELVNIREQHMQPNLAWDGARRDAGPARQTPPLSDRPLSDAVTALYNDPPTLLKYRVEELASAVRELCAQAATSVSSEPELAGVVQARANDLLQGTDGLLEQLQQEHATSLAAAASFQWRLYAVLLAAMLGAGVLLAGPDIRRGRARVRQRAAPEGSSAQRVSNHPAPSTPSSPPRSTSDPKTA
jgi:hypothetical protein